MYIFKKEMKGALLQGRTIRYLANNVLDMSSIYLTLILNGKQGCSKRMAKAITECGGLQAVLEDYFITKEK